MDKRSIRKKKKLVRLLRKAVDLIYGTGPRDRSGIEPDKSEVDARKLLKKLGLLAVEDPENLFGIYFTRLQIRIFKRLRVSSH